MTIYQWSRVLWSYVSQDGDPDWLLASAVYVLGFDSEARSFSETYRQRRSGIHTQLVIAPSGDGTGGNRVFHLGFG